MYLWAGTSMRVGCSSTSGLVVRSSATSQEARGEPPASDAQRPRVPRPKVKPREKWMKGDAPGEYGGPPIDLKIRPSWGGGPKEDPLTSTGDYIWKKVWQPFVETAPADVEPPPPPVNPYHYTSLISLRLLVCEELGFTLGFTRYFVKLVVSGTIVGFSDQLGLNPTMIRSSIFN